MNPRILVVATSNVSASELSRLIDERYGADAELHVLAPASGLSPLDWLTNAEDGARADAALRAEEAADAVAADAVVPKVGDTDPVQAIADELRTFPADEIVIVTRTAEERTWLERDAAEAARERFRIPIVHLVAS